MPQSMTGFGAAEGVVASGRLRVEVKTVNHRYFHFAPRLPHELAALEGEIRERVRRELDRGHVALSARWVEAAALSASAPMVDMERARSVAEQLKRLQVALGLEGEMSLDLVARQPGVLLAAEAPAVEVAWTEVEPVVAEAAAACRQMRQREGAVLGAELERLLALLETAAARVARRAPERLEGERQRLRRSVADLLDGHPLDEARVAHELAMAADRLDITEELVRFAAHIGACRAALAGAEPAGKRLGFLAQEMGREVNTMGAKANDAEIAHLVIGMKGDLERFREQLENLE